jgi:Tfp pilus assembly protein PilF
LEIYLVAYGKQCFERGLLTQARDAFRQATRVNPRSVGAMASRAALEERAGNHQAAARLWDRALLADPYNPRLRSRLAQLGLDAARQR